MYLPIIRMIVTKQNHGQIIYGYVDHWRINARTWRYYISTLATTTQSQYRQDSLANNHVVPLVHKRQHLDNRCKHGVRFRLTNARIIGRNQIVQKPNTQTSKIAERNGPARRKYMIIGSLSCKKLYHIIEHVVNQGAILFGTIRNVATQVGRLDKRSIY